MLSLRSVFLMTLCSTLALATILFSGCGDESTPSSPQGDHTAPVVPDGLAGRVAGGEVELLWNANLSDPDLAGYIVYRSQDARTGYAPITTTVGTNTWADQSTDRGRTYFYRVSAIDLVGNVSSMSEAMVISIGD